MSSTAKIQGGMCRTPDWPARKPAPPIIAAAATGPQSRWSAAREQYLDGSQAGIIAAHRGRGWTFPTADDSTPHFGPMHGSARRAAGDIIQVSLPSRTAPRNEAAGPAHAHVIAFAGQAAEAWLKPPKYGILSAYCPASWHHPQGVQKVVRRLMPRLPDVSGALFHTFTLDRRLFSDPAKAFDIARQRIRKIYARLRKGVRWEDKLYQIDAAYCVKVEFHADEEGWPHFHVIHLTPRFIPGPLIEHLWGFGRCHVERINNDRFHYLLKYVVKGGGYPKWVLSRKRLRVFQPSHRFMKKADEPASRILGRTARSAQPKRTRASYTIRRRLSRWSRMALFNENGRYCAIRLRRPFQKLFDQLIFSIAEGNRYLGNGFIKINEPKELIPWKLHQQIV